MVVRCIEEANREKHFLFRDFVKDNLKSPPLTILQPSLRQRKRNSGYFGQWTTGQCSREETCGMKRDHEHKQRSWGKGKVSRPSTSARRNSLVRGTPTGKVLKEKKNTSQHASFWKNGGCPKGNAWFLASTWVFFLRKRNCTRKSKCAEKPTVSLVGGFIVGASCVLCHFGSGCTYIKILVRMRTQWMSCELFAPFWVVWSRRRRNRGQAPPAPACGAFQWFVSSLFYSYHFAHTGKRITINVDSQDSLSMVFLKMLVTF